MSSGEKRDFDAAAATWDENPARVRMARDVAGTILGMVKPGPDADVLDFGCGTGLVTLVLQPHVRSVTAADSSTGMLAVLDAKIKAGSLANIRTLHIDLERGDMIGGQYDLVVSSMTFHHIPEVKPVIGLLAGILKPGGSLAIADLDSDEGQFHESGEGVFHPGFDRCLMRRNFEDAGLAGVRSRTAAIVRKPGASGELRSFTVFLMTGRKPA